MQILDGKLAAIAIKEMLKNKISELKISGKKIPHLAAILIGNNPASETYVASKVKSCNEVGITSTLLRFDDSIPEQDLLHSIRELNDNDDIDGILVQLPLPKSISEEKVINTISSEKDVDGFHPINVGKMVLELPTFISATPYGIILLLQHYKIETTGRYVVVIGRSNIVGTPISILLSRNTAYGNSTVTLCHSRTKNLKEICLQADIVIAAIGKPKFVTADMVKEDAVVIDVGINRIKDETKKSGYALTGDVDFENVAPKCSYISPVPGGVGLMTIAALLMNTYNACKQKH
ncbi:bifunctional 5,10-methylene-tetrahydrofolate dehydrogenase/5,10-methylene-tetrahydrofolate cyclohydrolase [Ginsengibacter hankyongi]|uniref:Bifunctional protein FolD n=1 Tax=Ginsengibacter hankyongi TaxID=2607284 RepID=A0A5J5ILU0_9BACT|nr:tetrahydrofolate dehydrogenase/cyclohydrolase catalytic domain-containing protein [Ginsengibacter hankyongi]KAA9041353.1 bifunctional 5,10-methylene-tetrahydrofolate dehydrogenase/5,10-methylene-tetrahydrofolate cyclohydrolase [Ginsengibacter hankyongi]